MNWPIMVAGAIWIGVAVTSQFMLARAARLLTPEQRDEVDTSSWETFLFARSLDFDLMILFVFGALVWLHAATYLFAACIVGVICANVVRDVWIDRRLQRLGLPRPHIKADRSARIVRFVGRCALMLPLGYVALRIN